MLYSNRVSSISPSNAFVRSSCLLVKQIFYYELIFKEKGEKEIMVFKINVYRYIKK